MIQPKGTHACRHHQAKAPATAASAPKANVPGSGTAAVDNWKL